MIEKKNMLGVGITNATKGQVLEYIVKSIENFKKKYYVVTPNPEFLVLANKNSDFKDILNRADLASADGIGVIIASRLLGKPLKGRFTGVELVESLCRQVVEKPITVGFLGGRGRVAERTAECLLLKHPGLQIGFVGQEWSMNGFKTAKELESRIKNQESWKKNDHNSLFMIHNSIDILFVAFGAPKQEIWMSENLPKIPVKVAIGVGGAFDYISGKTPRAPLIIRSMGFEWLFRLIVQPWRFKRQLALIEFAFLVLKVKFKSSIA